MQLIITHIQRGHGRGGSDIYSTVFNQCNICHGVCVCVLVVRGGGVGGVNVPVLSLEMSLNNVQPPQNHVQN